MIISAINRDAAITQDIVATLEQIKQGGKPNKPLVLNHASGDTCMVDFYVDVEKTIPLFTENSNDNPDSFGVSGGRTIYTPPDEKINFAPAVSKTYSQPTYYVTASWGEYDPTVINLTYPNRDNLLFQSVLVTTDKNPSFTANQNTAILIAPTVRVVNTRANDDRAYVILEYELRVQMAQFQCGFSDEDRVLDLMAVGNMIRNALYADRYRGGNCTLMDENLNGTFISPATPLPSTDLLKGSMRIQCVFVAASTGW